MTNTKIISLPLLALRGNVVLPHQVHPLGAGRAVSIKALEMAVENDGKILCAVQKNFEKEDGLELSDVWEIGTVAQIVILQQTEQGVQFAVKGENRARIVGLRLVEDGYYLAELENIIEVSESSTNNSAMLGSIKQILGQVLQLATTQGRPDILQVAMRMDNSSIATDTIAGNLGLEDVDLIPILQELNADKRMQIFIPMLSKRLEVAKIQEDIQRNVAKSLGQTQKEVILREQLKVIQKELAENGENGDDPDDLRTKLKNANLPEAVQQKMSKEVNRLENIPSMSPEVGMLRNYIDWVLDLPWKDAENEKIDIHKAEQILNEDHYGLLKIKERILEWMAIRQRVSEKNRQGLAKTPILCLVGPPGVGKTSLGKSIARALDREFERISLGGMRDEAEIRGHRRTYIGALPGRIIQAMKKVGVKNPVIMLDEIDKVGSDFRGDPAAALLEVLDPEQNSEFSDHYIEFPYDLSQVLFITTANVIDPISAPLRDRMEIIQIPGYTEEEKLGIAKEYLIPKQMTAHALLENEMAISDAAIKLIISRYTREAGVRALDRQLAKIMRKLPKRFLDEGTKNINITTENLIQYLGPPLFQNTEIELENQVGIVNGVVVSGAGGSLATIEALAIEGQSTLTLTGQLGEVMKESAMAGLSWIRAHGDKYGVKKLFFETHGVHIHVPEGAIPKDGPSAGVTITTALASIGSDRAVRQDVAMTGEVTLRGRILPIGGVKDKLLAAKRAGILLFLLPKQNERDLYEIEHELLAGMEIKFVDNMDEVLEFALVDLNHTPRSLMGFKVGEQLSQQNTIN